MIWPASGCIWGSSWLPELVLEGLKLILFKANHASCSQRQTCSWTFNTTTTLATKIFKMAFNPVTELCVYLQMKKSSVIAVLFLLSFSNEGSFISMFNFCRLCSYIHFLLWIMIRVLDLTFLKLSSIQAFFLCIFLEFILYCSTKVSQYFRGPCQQIF